MTNHTTDELPTLILAAIATHEDQSTAPIGPTQLMGELGLDHDRLCQQLHRLHGAGLVAFPHGSTGGLSSPFDTPIEIRITAAGLEAVGRWELANHTEISALAAKQALPVAGTISSALAVEFLKRKLGLG